MDDHDDTTATIAPTATTGAGRRDPATAVAILRERSRPHDVLGGFGPLVVAAVLALVMILAVPSVAPEQVVEQPAGTATAVEADR